MSDEAVTEAETFPCGECGMHVIGPEYHPYLFCELFKLGHADPAGYLRQCGFDRECVVADVASGNDWEAQMRAEGRADEV